MTGKQKETTIKMSLQ